MSPVGPRRGASAFLPQPPAARLSCSPALGATEAILAAHGISIELMVKLVRAGLATATAERIVAGGKSIEIAHVRITEAGWQAIDAGW